MTISRAYRVGIILTTVIIRVFPAVGAFVFVWLAVISAHVGFAIAYLAKVSRMTSFTYPIMAGASSLVVAVARPSSNYRLASISSRTVRTSWDNTLGSRPKGSWTPKPVRIPYIFN